MQPTQREQKTPQGDGPAPDQCDRARNSKDHPSATKDHQLGDLADLEMETKPEDVLAEIERLHKTESTKGIV